MKDSKHNKIKMATRIVGGKKKKDKKYDEFFLDETDAVRNKAKEPDILVKGQQYAL